VKNDPKLKGVAMLFPHIGPRKAQIYDFHIFLGTFINFILHIFLFLSVPVDLCKKFNFIF
jgi:hypothetical protein